MSCAVKQFKEKFENLREERDKYEERIQSLRERINEQLNRLEENEREVCSLTRRECLLNESNDKLSVELVAKTAQLKDLNERFRESESQRMSLETENDRLEDENSELSKKGKELREWNEATENKLSQIVVQNNSLRTGEEALSSNVDNFRSLVNQSTEEYLRVSADLSEMQSVCDQFALRETELEGVIESLRSEILSKESTLAELVSNNRRLGKDYNILEDEKDSLEKTRIRIQNELDSVMADLGTLVD